MSRSQEHVFFILRNMLLRNIGSKSKKIKKHVRNIARLRFRNLQKRILINQTIFERKYLQNTTNETNVNMFMYKVYLTLISKVGNIKNVVIITSYWFNNHIVFFLVTFFSRRTNIGTSESSEW